MIDVLTNLPRCGPKWNSANYELGLRNDEVGVTKRSGGECMEDK